MSNQDAPKGKVGLLGRMFTGKTFKTKAEVEAEQKQKEAERIEELRRAAESGQVPPFHKRPSLKKIKTAPDPNTPRKAVSFAGEVDVSPDPYDPEVDDVPLHDGDGHYDDHDHYQDGHGYSDDERDDRHPDDRQHEYEASPRAEHDESPHDERESPSPRSPHGRDDSYSHSSQSESEDIGPSDDDLQVQDNLAVRVIHPPAFNMPQSLSSVADGVMAAGSTHPYKRSATTATSDVFGNKTSGKAWHDTNLEDQMREATRATTLPASALLRVPQGPGIQRTNTNTSNSSVSNYSTSNTGTESSDSESEADTIGLELGSGAKAQLNAIVREQVAAATLDAVAEAVHDDILESTVKSESQAVARAALNRSSPSSSPLAAPALSKVPTLGGSPKTAPTFAKMPTLGGSPKTAPAAASLSMFAPLDSSSSPEVVVPSAETVPAAKLAEDFAKFEKLRARRAPSTHTAYVSPYARDDSDPGVIAKHYEASVKAAPRRSATQSANHSVAVITTNLFGRTSSHSDLQAPQVFSMAMNTIAERRQKLAESPGASQELSLIDEDPDSEINSPRAAVQAQAPPRAATVRGSLMGSPQGSRAASLLNTARSISLQRTATRMFSSLSAAPAKPAVTLPPATAAALAATKPTMPSLASVVHAMMRAGKNKNQGKSTVLRSAVNKVRSQLQEQKKQKAATPSALTTATDDEYLLAQKALEAAKSHIAAEEAAMADEVVIRSLMDDMLDGVVQHIANDRWHDAVNKTWRAKKQRVELTKLVTEQKTQLTKLMTQNRQIEKQRQDAPKRPLPKLFTLIKTKGLAAAAAAVSQQAKKPFAFTSVVKQAQKAAKNLKAAVAARKEAEAAAATIPVPSPAPVAQEPIDPDVQDVMSFLVETVVDSEETLSHDEEIDRTVAFVLGGLVTKVEESAAAAELLSKPEIQVAIVEKAVAVAAKPPSEEEIERPVARFQPTPAINAALEAARLRALQLDHCFNTPERTLLSIQDRFAGKEQALAALSAKRKEEEWGKKRQVKQIAANAMQLGQEVYRTLADSKEKQRMLERQAMRAQAKKELDAFNKVAEEEAAARIAAGEDADVVHRQMRVAKAAALAHNFRNQQQIRTRTDNGEAFAFVADSIAQQGEEDNKMSEDYATELSKLQTELSAVEKEAVESDDTMKKRLGRSLTEDERRSQDEKRVAHARRLFELRKSISALKSAQYRRLAARTQLPREQRARDYGARKTAEKLLAAEENRRKAEDLIKKKALEREKAVVNPAVKEVLDDLIFHVEAEERAQTAIQDELDFCIRTAEREAHNRETVRRDLATLQTHEQKTRRETIAELEDQLAAYEDRREMEKKAADEKFQTLRRAFPNAHPQWTFTKIHSLQLEYVARMERDEAARVEAQKKEMAIVRTDLNTHLAELERSRNDQDADAQVAHVVDVMCMFVEDDFNTWSVKKAAEEKARRLREAEDARKKQQAELQATKLREVGVKATMESLLTAVEREVEKGIVAEVVADLVATTEANLVFEQLLEEILPKEAKPIAKASREEFVLDEMVDAETNIIAREEFLQAEVQETMSDIMHVILIRHYGKFLKQQFTILREAAKRSRRLGTWAIERMRPYIERAKKRVNIRKTIEEKKRKEAELQLRLLEEAQKRKAAQEAELARLNAMQVEERNKEIRRIREHEAAIVLQRYYRIHRNKRIHSSIEHRSEMAIRIQKVFRGYTARKQLGVQYTAAQKIQGRFRGFLVRKKLRLENAAAVEVQRFYRGYKTRKAVEQYQYYLKDLQQQLASNEAKLRRVYEDMKKLRDAKASTARDARLAALTADFEKLKEARKELRAEMKKSPKIRDFWHGANAKHGTQFKAATTIQRVFRGYKHRVDFRKTKAAVIQIQRVFRGHKGRKAYLATRELSRREQEDVARMERVTKERAIVEAAKKEQWALEAHIREVEYKEKERLEEVEQMTARRQSQIQIQREENEKRERERLAQEQLLLTSRKRLESTIDQLKAKKEAALALLTKKEKEDEKKYGTNRTVITTSARRRKDELNAQRSKIEEEATKLEVTACLEFVISAVEKTENTRIETMIAEQLQREKEMRARMRAEKKALLERLKNQISTEEQRRIDLEAQAKKQLEETLKKRGLRSQVGGDSTLEGPDMGPEVHSLTPEQLEKERKEAERKRVEAQKEQKRKELEAQLAKLEAMKKAEQQRAAKDKKWESILRIATTGDASIGDLCSITDAEVEHPSIDDVSKAPTLSAADKTSGKKQKVFHTGKTPRGARRESSRMGLVGGAGSNSPSSTPPLSPQNSDSNLRRKPTEDDGCTVM